MNIVDFVALGIIILILGFAILYIRSSKKKGKKCIGCPEGGKCSECSYSCKNSNN